MKQNILVLYSKEYNIPASEGQRELKGVSVYYLFNDNLKPITNNDMSQGYRPAKASISFDDRFKLKAVPAIYEAEFGMSVDVSGKPILKLLGLNYSEDFTAIPPFKK